MDYTNYGNNVNISNNNGNNTEAGYNKSFGYPSGSRTAESGPLSRFRQNHGYENTSPTMSNEINRNYQSQERAEMFLNHNYFPNYSSGGSRPESVMSNFSTFSVATNMSEISVITDISQFSTHMGGDSSGGMIYQNHNTYPPSSFSSYERQSNASMLQPNELLENLRLEIEKGDINCNEKLLEAKARAKSQCFELVSSEILTKFVRTLFVQLYHQNLPKNRDYKIIGNIISVLYYLLHNNNIQTQKLGRAKSAIINFLRKHEMAVTLLLDVLQTDLGFEFKKLLINFINTIIHVTKTSSKIKSVIQNHPNILSTYLTFIQCDHKNIYSISMDTLTRIIAHSNLLKTQFMEQNGIKIVLNIIANENQEKILFRAAELLLCSLQTNNDNITTRFIKLNGIDICSRLLDHGSSRLLIKLVECIGSVCDKLSNTNFDPTESFQYLIKIIGSQDHNLESKVVGCLGNMISNNNRSKKLLCDLNVPTILLRAIICFTDPGAQIYPKTKTELLDNILFVLQGLTAISVPIEIKNVAIVQIINYGGKIWEKWFMFFIEHEQIYIVNRAILIIYNVLMQVNYIGLNINENISAFKGLVEFLFLRVYQAAKLLNPGDQQTLTKIWNESRLFEPNANLCPTPEEYEKQQKSIKQLLSRSLKLLRVLINDTEAKQILASKIMLQRDFPINYILAYTTSLEVCESMFAIAAALLQFKPEFIHLWHEKELDSIYRNAFPFCHNNPELNKSVTAFCDTINNIRQQQSYLRQFHR